MKAIEKELKKIEKAEKRMRLKAEKKEDAIWKQKLEEKIPEKVMAGLQKAFVNAFYLIFENGTAIIEKTYDKEAVEKEFLISDYALTIRGGKREIDRMKKEAANDRTLAALATAVSGIGLGALGIGLPDIVLWVGTLLRGIYETALRYGYDYESPEERVFILKIMEVPMLAKDAWVVADQKVDHYIRQDAHVIPTEEELKRQIEKTAGAFATDMLVMKFIQGIPIVGMIGGAANPLYYHRVMNYVQLKYRRRYLLSKLQKR